MSESNPSIYPALASVMLSISAVAKDSVNKFQNFNFRSIDAVMNELHGHMAQNKIVVVPQYGNYKRELVTKKDGKVEVSVSIDGFVSFVSCEDGSKVIAGPFYAEAFDSSDKATTKAMSMLLKYALLQFFLIPTVEQKDGDADSPTPPVRDRAPQNQQRPQNEPARERPQSHEVPPPATEQASQPATPTQQTPPAPSVPTEKPVGNRKRCEEIKDAYAMAATEAEIDTVRELALNYSWGDVGLQQLTEAETEAKARVEKSSKKALPASEPASGNAIVSVTEALMLVTSVTSIDECNGLTTRFSGARWSKEDREMFDGAIRSKIRDLTPIPSSRPKNRDALIARIQQAITIDSLRLLAPQNIRDWSPDDAHAIRQAYVQRESELRTTNTNPPKVRRDANSFDPYAPDRYTGQRSNRTGD